MSSVTPFRLQDIEDEPRVLDVDLGAALGMAQPRNIRQTIATNKAELDSFGPSHEARAMVDIGSGSQREVTTYWLNESQALLLCMFARTPKAAEVRRMLIDAFMQWRRERMAGHQLTKPSSRLAMLEARVAQLEGVAAPKALPTPTRPPVNGDRAVYFMNRIVRLVRSGGGAVTKTDISRRLPHYFAGAQISEWLERLVASGRLERSIEPRGPSFAAVYYERQSMRLPMIKQDHPEFARDNTDPRERVDALFLTLLEEATADGRALSNRPSKTYAPAVFAASPKAGQITRRGFEAAMTRLLEVGRIQAVQFGPPSHRRWRIEVAED